MGTHDKDPRTDAELRADWAHANDLDKPVTAGPDDPSSGVAAMAAATTILVLLLAPVAFFFAALSVMATDSCGPDDCSAALEFTLSVIYTILPVGGFFSLVALVLCWVLPWRVRFDVWRRWAALVAVAPHVVLIMLVLTLPEG
ncbi:hypothetical protein ACIBI4_26435 [Streptomyces sp. NPDC050418]|uniref:hypothetical protein n=1 Tax=Streptomyces sp. NPDC050418 TaxID=3365612 RepID=UPI00378C0D39